MKLRGQIHRVVRGVLLAAVVAVPLARADVRIVGTDLLDLETSRALYAFSGAADFRLGLALDGSRPGLDQLKTSRADVGLLLLPADESETALAGFECPTLAYECVTVLVPASIPLKQITLGQLRDIFGESGSSNLSRWGDLDVEGEVGGTAILPHVPAMGQGIAAELFRQMVLKDRPFKSTIGRFAGFEELASRLSDDRRAITLAPGGTTNGAKWRRVPVALRSGQPAFSATPENVHSGDYPLALPLRIVFRRHASRSLRPLLRFLYSDEFARAIERSGLVPLAASARYQQTLVLEKL